MKCRDYEPFVPQLENPYPDHPRPQISEFAYHKPLHLCRCIKAVQLREGEDADYVVSQPYTVRFKLDGADREITVPEGMLTDLSSVPSAARWLIGRVGPHLEASIVHDFLYIAWQDLEGREALERDRKFADKIMCIAMEKAEVRPWKRCIIYLAVRLFGAGAYVRRDAVRYVRDL